MNKRYFVSIVCLVLPGLLVSCNQAKSQNETINKVNENLPVPQASSTVATFPSDESVSSLCERLNEIKRIPYDPRKVAGDPIYDGLMRRGREAIPCLVEKITDTTLMADPNEAPKIHDFRVGDAAVFMLLYITNEDWQPETMLSPKYAKLWKTEGVYAYSAYVEKLENRKKIQLWWRDWMKKNLTK